MTSSFLKVTNLSKKFSNDHSFFRKSSQVIALDAVSFEIKKGETLGLVGESGSGKSTLARCLTRLLDVSSGHIEFQGEDITHWQGEKLRFLRRKIQIVFQDPFSSLNPRMTIAAALEEPLKIHHLIPTAQARQDRVDELLRLVGLQADMKSRYPREFSGGQRQRIGIARALAVQPELIICDEAVSSLDVSIQAQIINLLMALQKSLGLTYLFIAHDLRVVEHVSNRVAVMQSGNIVEIAPTQTLFKMPAHAYTRTLLASCLRIQEAEGIKI